MASSPGFGSCVCHQNALLRLAFTVASFPQELNQATHSTLVGSFFNRNAVTDLRPLQLLVSVRFQKLFHRPPGLLFSFPSLYLFTIGQEEYLALAHRRACFQRDFSSLVVLEINTTGLRIFAYRTITVFGSIFQWILLIRCSLRVPSWVTHALSHNTFYNDSPSSPECLRLYLRRTQCKR